MVGVGAEVAETPTPALRDVAPRREEESVEEEAAGAGSASPEPEQQLPMAAGTTTE